MQTFRDTLGREWIVTIDIAALKRVRSQLNVDLLDIIQGDLLERLSRDPVLLCDILYVLCRPQADERKLSDEDFGRAMSGQALADATTAFFEALADFFPGPRAGLLREMIARAKQLETQLIDRAISRLSDPQLLSRVEEETTGGA